MTFEPGPRDPVSACLKVNTLIFQRTAITHTHAQGCVCVCERVCATNRLEKKLLIPGRCALVHIHPTRRPRRRTDGECARAGARADGLRETCACCHSKESTAQSRTSSTRRRGKPGDFSSGVCLTSAPSGFAAAPHRHKVIARTSESPHFSLATKSRTKRAMPTPQSLDDMCESQGAPLLEYIWRRDSRGCWSVRWFERRQNTEREARVRNDVRSSNGPHQY